MKIESCSLSMIALIAISAQILKSSMEDSMRDRERQSLIDSILTGDMNALRISAGRVSLNFSSNKGHTPLTGAITCAMPEGNNHIVQLLLQRGADASFASINCPKPLVQVIRTGNKECVRILLKAGADPNASRTTMNDAACVYYAAQHSPEMLDLLLDAGGNVDKASDDV